MAAPDIPAFPLTPPSQNHSPRKFPRLSDLYIWAILLGYVGFIWATLSVVPDWREALTKRFGEGVFLTITLGAALLLMTVILAVLVFKYRQKKITAYLSLLLIFGVLYYLLRYWITIPVEQIHFIEYGLVGFLSYQALRRRLRGWGLVLTALLLTYLFGMIDECIQGNLASRVGEQRDMYWNGLAGVLSLAVIVFAFRPAVIRGRSSRPELAVALFIFAACLPLQGYFNSKIAQFGILIEDEARGVIFRSRLRPEALWNYNDLVEDFKEKILSRAGKVRMVVLLPEVYDKTHEEALVHIFRRGQYFRGGNYPVAYKENLIISGYFPQFVAGTEHDWAGEKVRQLQASIGALAFSTYESPVAGHLITKFKEGQMWGLIGLLEGFMLLTLIKLKRKSSADKIPQSFKV